MLFMYSRRIFSLPFLSKMKVSIKTTRIWLFTGIQFKFSYHIFSFNKKYVYPNKIIVATGAKAGGKGGEWGKGGKGCKGWGQRVQRG